MISTLEEIQVPSTTPNLGFYKCLFYIQNRVLIVCPAVPPPITTKKFGHNQNKFWDRFETLNPKTWAQIIMIDQSEVVILFFLLGLMETTCIYSYHVQNLQVQTHFHVIWKTNYFIHPKCCFCRGDVFTLESSLSSFGG